MRITKDPDVRRQELLDLAQKLFLEKGFDKVSIREIVNETDSMGSPGLFYYYFKSKKEIYQAVIDQIVDEEIKARQSILATASHAKGHEVENIVKLLNSIQADAVKLEKLQLKSADSQLIHSVSERLIASEETMIHDLIDKMLEEKVVHETMLLNKDTSDYLTKFLIYGSNGILANLNAGDDRKAAVAYVRTFIGEVLQLNI